MTTTRIATRTFIFENGLVFCLFSAFVVDVDGQFISSELSGHELILSQTNVLLKHIFKELHFVSSLLLQAAIHEFKKLMFMFSTSS